jgi:hypothetical protein
VDLVRAERRRLALDPDALLALAKALKCRMEDLIASK